MWGFRDVGAHGWAIRRRHRYRRLTQHTSSHHRSPAPTHDAMSEDWNPPWKRDGGVQDVHETEVS